MWLSGAFSKGGAPIPASVAHGDLNAAIAERDALRAALKVACDEITKHRKPRWRASEVEDYMAAKIATDAAIDLATGEPRR